MLTPMHPALYSKLGNKRANIAGYIKASSLLNLHAILFISILKEVYTTSFQFTAFFSIPLATSMHV